MYSFSGFIDEVSLADIIITYFFHSSTLEKAVETGIVSSAAFVRTFVDLLEVRLLGLVAHGRAEVRVDGEGDLLSRADVLRDAADVLTFFRLETMGV
jgi:hypothetical protein